MDRTAAVHGRTLNVEFKSLKTTPEPANQELLPTSAELELAEDGVEDACDSDAELVCANLGGVDISGGSLAVQQAIQLYSALVKKTPGVVKKECESGGESE